MEVTKSFLITAILLCIAWPLWAKTYTVAPGNTLGGIAMANGTSVTELVRLNGIANKDIIRIGQKLEIPEKGAKVTSSVPPKKNWHPGSNPWKLSREEGIKGLRFTPFGEAQLINAVKNDDHFSEVKIYRDGRVEDVYGNQYEMVLMGFGKGGFFIPVPAWKDQMRAEAGWIYKSGTAEYVAFPFICQNPTRVVLVKKADEKKADEPKLDESQKKNIATKVPTKAIGPRCSTCKDEYEVDMGGYYSFRNDTSGFGLFGELLFWRNFAEDCSSEYSWGMGVLGSAYWYAAMDFPTEGNGYRLALQGGIKRTWLGGEKLLIRQWILKLRFPAIGEQEWRNMEKGWSINQFGPLAGLYAEYRHELIKNKLTAFATVEVWTGLGNEKVSSSFAGTKASNQTFAEVVFGIDYEFYTNWVWRNYAGLAYQGYDDLFPFVLGTELRHELAKGWGTVAVGLKANIYTAINPTGFVYAKWEINKPIDRWLDKCRQGGVQEVGTGIGINQIRQSVSVSVSVDQESILSDRIDIVMASLGNNSNK